MARRRYRTRLLLERTEDPGKDLYAYLYLITIVSFILFVTAGKMQGDFSPQPAPETIRLPDTAALAAISPDQLGRIVKTDGEIFLFYDGTRYRPEDVERLSADGRIETLTEKGQPKRMLYLNDQKTQRILLSEYLSAFSHLSSRGIGIAFADPLNPNAGRR